jgi:hypothetical protein
VDPAHIALDAVATSDALCRTREIKFRSDPTAQPKDISTPRVSVSSRRGVEKGNRMTGSWGSRLAQRTPSPHSAVRLGKRLFEQQRGKIILGLKLTRDQCL